MVISSLGGHSSCPSFIETILWAIIIPLIRKRDLCIFEGLLWLPKWNGHHHHNFTPLIGLQWTQWLLTNDYLLPAINGSDLLVCWSLRFSWSSQGNMSKWILISQENHRSISRSTIAIGKMIHKVLERLGITELSDSMLRWVQSSIPMRKHSLDSIWMAIVSNETFVYPVKQRSRSDIVIQMENYTSITWSRKTNKHAE